MSGRFSARLSKYYVLLDELRELRVRRASDDEDLDKQEKIEVLVDDMTESEREIARRYTWRAWPEQFAAHVRVQSLGAPSAKLEEGDTHPPRRRVA